MKEKISTKKLVITALLAALTVVGSWLRITIPLDIGGTTSFHLGNIMCALSGILLGPWLGGLAAGLGSAIYDMFNPLYISEAWMTFLMKFAYGLAAGLVIRCGKQPWGYVRAVLASAAGALTYAALYLAKSYYYGGLLLQGLEPAAALAAVSGGFAKILQNVLPQTLPGVGIAHHGIQLLKLHLQPFFRFAALLQQIAVHMHIGIGEKQHAQARQPVAAGTANLLVI